MIHSDLQVMWVVIWNGWLVVELLNLLFSPMNWCIMHFLAVHLKKPGGSLEVVCGEGSLARTSRSRSEGLFL